MTEEEYHRLRDTADGHGARSVSEFARTALLTSPANSMLPAPKWCQTLDALTERIAKVEQDVAQVKDRLL